MKARVYKKMLQTKLSSPNKFVRYFLTLALSLPFSYVPMSVYANVCSGNAKGCGPNASPPKLSGTAGGASNSGQQLEMGARSEQGFWTGRAAACKKAASDCQSQCKGSSVCKQYDERAAQAAGNAASSGNVADQSAASKEAAGAGGGGDIGSLLGALLPLAMMMMMMKKNDKKKENKGALQANGQLDCSKYDAYKYQACNTLLMANCVTNLESELCKNFSARFCNIGSSSGGGGTPIGGSTPGGGTGNGVVIQSASGLSFDAPAAGVAGEGMGSQYCQTALAYNYCKGGGRDSCPSCRQLQAYTSPACLQNPTLCLSQNTPDQIEQAKMSCPTDPMFSNPNFANSMPGGGTPVTGAPPGLPPPPGLPGGLPPPSGLPGGLPPPSGGGGGAPVVLPQSVAGKGGQGSVREGGGARGVASGSGVSTSSASGSGGPVGSHSEIAGSGSQRSSGYQTASAAGPAPDVQSQYSQSLFTTSSEVLRHRCQLGRLLNCP